MHVLINSLVSRCASVVISKIYFFIKWLLETNLFLVFLLVFASLKFYGVRRLREHLFAYFISEDWLHFIDVL